MLTPFCVKIINTFLTHFSKNFVRENFLERMFDFNGILTKTADFDKKVSKFIFYIVVSSFTPNRPHKA